MNSVAEELQIQRLSITDSSVHFYLKNKLVITAPLENFPALNKASTEEQAKWEITADGTGARWAELDVELSLPDLLGLFT